MQTIRRIKKLVLLITLPLVMWLFFNQVAFWHYHILENGVVVEHAHPFKNSTLPGTPYQQHQHSDFEYSLLAQISSIIGLLVFLVVLGLFMNNNLKRLAIKPTARLIPVYFSVNRLRGPPVIS
ncbi:MAG: hypothetical protein EA361_14760 [Bacteroidetes bacterium]|nr:MAG: hypothetical protein EA361_14760 [Bacteroidota bacterium]